jgi:glycosyltransferase involved in cell wall biosynthesis
MDSYLHTMHILYFPTRFYPAISGGDFYMQRLGEEMVRRGHQVLFFSTDAIDFGALAGNGKWLSTDSKYYHSYKNLLIHRWPILRKNQLSNKNLDEYREKISNFILFAAKLLKIDANVIQSWLDKGPRLLDLEEYLMNYPESEKNYPSLTTFLQFRPLIIHCTYLPYANLLYSIMLAVLHAVPCAVTPFLHFENVRYQNEYIFLLLSFFDAVFACTQTERNFMIAAALNSARIHVVPMGIDVSKFTPDKRSRFTDLFPIPAQSVLFCGNKNFEKGALSVLGTIPFLITKFPDITYIMIGPSTAAFNYELDKWRKQYSTVRIVNLTPENLTGVYDPIKIGAFQIADVYCMPSRSDAYGIAYLEAWACKKPVIAADIPAMGDVIQNGETGLLVPFDNPKLLAEKITQLLKDPKKAQYMGENGYKKIKQQNPWKMIAQNTENIYQALIHCKEDKI